MGAKRLEDVIGPADLDRIGWAAHGEAILGERPYSMPGTSTHARNQHVVVTRTDEHAQDPQGSVTTFHFVPRGTAKR